MFRTAMTPISITNPNLTACPVCRVKCPTCHHPHHERHTECLQIPNRLMCQDITPKLMRRRKLRPFRGIRRRFRPLTDPRRAWTRPSPRQPPFPSPLAIAQVDLRAAPLLNHSLSFHQRNPPSSSGTPAVVM